MTVSEHTPDRKEKIEYPKGYKTGDNNDNKTLSGIKFRIITPEEREKLRIHIYDYLL